MAIFDGKFFRGSAGPVIYKTYRGQQLVVGKAEDPYNMSEGSMATADIFGKASKLASGFRAAWSTYTNNYEGAMPNRLTGEVQYCMLSAFNKATGQFEFSEHSFQRLNGFEYNMNSPVRDNFFIHPQVSYTESSLTVDVPAIRLPEDLKFPDRATNCCVYITVAMFDLAHGKYSLCPAHSIEIERTFDDATIEPKHFEFVIEPGCLCLVIFYLQYTAPTFGGKMIVNTKAFSPSALLKAVVVPGTVNKDKLTTGPWKNSFFPSEEK